MEHGQLSVGDLQDDQRDEGAGEAPSSRFWVLWPMFDRKTEGSEASSRFLWQLAVSERTAESSTFRMFYKLVEWTHEQKEQHRLLRVAPLFTRETWENGDSYTSVLGSMFSYYREEDRKSPGSHNKRLRLFWLPIDWRSGQSMN